MESELPILLYMFSVALAAFVLVPACRLSGAQQPIQIRCRSHAHRNAILSKP